ncbi:MAG: HD domain-containing protein [Nanoarchaeota archaeon]|nr:HD domain-containing protein [Nanoarchaeota archaeon]
MKDNTPLEDILQEKDMDIESSLFFVFADDETPQLDSKKGLIKDYEEKLLEELNSTIGSKALTFPKINEMYFNGFLNIQGAYDFISGLPENTKVVVLTDERFSDDPTIGKDKNGHNLIYNLLGYELLDNETKKSEKHESQLNKIVSMTITSAFMRDHYEEILRLQRPDVEKGKINVNFVTKEEFAKIDLEYELLNRIVVKPIISQAKDKTIFSERIKYKELSHLFENQKELLLEVFFDTLFLKDHKVTPFHVYRVSKSAEKIAGLMDYDEDMKEKIKWAGYLHDIGKLAVHDDLLKSKDTYNIGQRIEMLEHGMYSMFILDSMKQIITDKNFEKWFDEVIEIAYSHHEKRTGDGYPRGISDELTDEMEILICADIYDARRQERDYKNAESHRDVIKGLYELAEKKEISSKVIDKMNTDEFEKAYARITEDAENKRVQYEKPLKEAKERLLKIPLYQNLMSALEGV